MSEQPPAARPRSQERNWDAYAAVIASFMAVLALLVGAYTAYLQRQQVRAQVWPRLEIYRSNDRAIEVKNSGTGPARLRAVRVELDGRPLKDWAELMRAFGHESDYGHSTLGRRVLPAGEKIEAFNVRDTDKGHKAFAEVFGNKNAKRIGMLICYCSVLDQCWLAGGYSGNVDVDMDREIDQCPIADADRFLQ